MKPNIVRSSKIMSKWYNDLTLTSCFIAINCGLMEVNLTSPNSIQAHTQIFSIEFLILWVIALSRCCCSCNAKNVIDSAPANACDQGCEEYCRKKCYGLGKYNGKVPCLPGVVSIG